MSNSEPITKDVTGLQFSIMSPDEIRKQSVVEVTKHETYVASYVLDNAGYQGRKCIYDYAGSKFSVIEVFLFND